MQVKQGGNMKMENLQHMFKDRVKVTTRAFSKSNRPEFNEKLMINELRYL